MYTDRKKPYRSPRAEHRDGQHNYSERSTYEGAEQTATEYTIGRNALRELLSAGSDIDKIYTQKGEKDGSLLALLREANDRRIPVVECDRNKLNDMCGTTSHQGVVCTVPQCSYATIDDIFAAAEERGEKPLIVVCDGITDPHNLGAIIRTAECTGVHGVIIPARRSAGINAVVSKASAGALCHIHICRVTNIARTLDELKKRGVWVYAAHMQGDPYFTTDMTGSAAIVLGGEGDGISRLVMDKCDFKVSIPLYGKVNSLNVSNAAAVILCECARSRRSK